MGKHKEWRKLAKKFMRKRRRSRIARERDAKLQEDEKRRAASPSYQEWLAEQQQLEEFQNQEDERIRAEKHRLWLLEEEAAQERWLKQQQRLERLKSEKAKQELLIREEWEREQAKLELEAAKREEERENRKREEVIEWPMKHLRPEAFKRVLGETENLPSSARTITETQPGCEPCPFFSKVAACRFRDACSRNHLKPSVSRTLVIPNFYSHFRMEHVSRNNEYDTDLGLEYDDREIYDHFLEFYDDVLSELKKFGTVTQFKVCCNEEPHLRGNVYVQYQSDRSAIKAFRVLQGRFYGGKRVSAEFCEIPSWSKALCGLFSRRKCTKGGKCNFLHTFRNPNSEFIRADRDALKSPSPARSTREKNNWSWSPSPVRECERDKKRDENTSERRRRSHSRHSSHRSSRNTSHSKRKHTDSSPESSRSHRLRGKRKSTRRSRS